VHPLRLVVEEREKTAQAGSDVRRPGDSEDSILNVGTQQEVTLHGEVAAGYSLRGSIDSDIEGTEEVTTIPNSLGVCDECGYLVCPFNASLVPQ
jgi:hypothetical protein